MAPAVIALSGFMGSGKTTVGRFVADALGSRFVDLDREVERRERCSVSDLFARDGEAGFRRAELAALGEVLADVVLAAVNAAPGPAAVNSGCAGRAAARGGVVLALGGGALTRARARSLLKTKGAVVVYLHTPTQEAWKRVRGSGRPLAASWEAFAALAAERTDIYEESADVVIETTGLSPLEVAARVVNVVSST